MRSLKRQGDTKGRPKERPRVKSPEEAGSGSRREARRDEKKELTKSGSDVKVSLLTAQKAERSLTTRTDDLSGCSVEEAARQKFSTK
jgi:hypothetical protein